jgi:hypothetical protein
MIPYERWIGLEDALKEVQTVLGLPVLDAKQWLTLALCDGALFAKTLLPTGHRIFFPQHIWMLKGYADNAFETGTAPLEPTDAEKHRVWLSRGKLQQRLAAKKVAPVASERTDALPSAQRRLRKGSRGTDKTGEIRRTNILEVIATTHRLLTKQQIAKWSGHKMSHAILEKSGKREIAGFKQSTIVKILNGDYAPAAALGIKGIRDGEGTCTQEK